MSLIWSNGNSVVMMLCQLTERISPLLSASPTWPNPEESSGKSFLDSCFEPSELWVDTLPSARFLPPSARECCPPHRPGSGSQHCPKWVDRFGGGHLQPRCVAVLPPDGWLDSCRWNCCMGNNLGMLTTTYFGTLASIVNIERLKHHRRLDIWQHITPEAPLSAQKSAIAENGMGVTSRP